MAWFKRSTSRPATAPIAALPRRPLVMALEPRVMFDGAVAATVAEVAPQIHAEPVAAPHVDGAAHHRALEQPIGLMLHGGMRSLDEHDADVPAASAPPHDVLFIDARVQDAGSLITHVAAGTDIVYLQQGRDGLEQMRDYLAQHPGASSVQILAHGNDGDLWLGNTYLSADNVGQHADVLAQIGADIKVGGDILIYACDTAAGDKGVSFVNSLASLTHRDIAASVNRIGAGYDWNLELTTGSIEARQVLSGTDEAGYTHDLAIITVTSNADAGAGSLRSAIASATAGDTITFSSAMTISLSTHASGDSLLLINKNLTIEGDIDGNGTADVTLDGQYSGRVLEITSGSTVTLDGLVIEHGLVYGNGGNGISTNASDLNGGDALGAGISNAGNLTLSGVTVTGNRAAGGGGGSFTPSADANGNAGFSTYGFGGGGGGGFNGIGGGDGGQRTLLDTSGSARTLGGGGVGGNGGEAFDYSAHMYGGQGGSTAGGAGAYQASTFGGGNGGTAGGIGGGGGGWGNTGGASGRGGDAAGGIFNSGTLTILHSTITDNAGAGGGGAGAAYSAGMVYAAGAGGIAAGALLNRGILNIDTATIAAFSGNAGQGGERGEIGGGETSPPAATGQSDTLSDAGGTSTTLPSAAITSATYNAATGVLTVTGTDMTAGDTINVSKLTFTGEGGATYTLTSSNVTASSATNFSVTLNGTDRAALNQIVNKDGTSSTGGTTFNLAAASNWDATASAGADASNAVTASNVAVPTITSATYDASTGSIVVTGTGFTHLSGANNDIVANKFTFTGEGGATYTLTDTANVEITSGTSFTLVLSATDKAGINLIENKNGTSSTGGTTYNLAAAEDWAAGADPTVVTADTTGNGITASNVAVPTITSATYDASTGSIVVTGTGFTHLSGANNDIVANKFTFTGEGGATYTLTDTANVEITSGTSFTLVLSATDKAGINLIENKNGTSSTGGTTYNLAAAEDWAAGADPTVVTADTTGNGITASNVAVPTITSATYDASTGSIVVTGTGFTHLSGANNDIVASKFTFTGEGGATYTLTDTANVEITSGTSFTLVLSATDKAGINLIENKNGTSSTGGTTYNLAAAEDWAAGADPTVVTADTTGNGITASNVAVPTITSATYDASTGSIVVTGTGFTHLSGANNDIVASKFTFTGEGGATYTLTDTANVEITSGTSFTLVLSATDKAGINLIENKNGTSSTGGTTYNLAAAEDWNSGADAAVTIADLAGNGITVSHVAPRITAVNVPADNTYIIGQSLDFEVDFDSAITVDTAGGTPRLAITLDTGGTVYATYVSGSGTSALTFRYTVASGSLDSNGVAVGALSANGGTLRNAAGDDAALTLNNVGSTAAVRVDGIAPSVSSITRVSSATTNATSVDYTVTFAEGVTGVDAADFALTATGTAAGTIASVTQVNASTYTVTVNTISGDGTLRLDLNGAGTGIADTPGNAIAAGYTSGQTYTVDHTAPVVSSVGVPANATYVAGDNLDFTVNFAEAVTVDTSGGTPRIAITLDTGGTVYADYVSGSGTSALTFRYTVASGNLDSNGIAVGSLSGNGGTLRDAAGNDAALTLNSVGSTASVLVDAVAPTISSVAVPADGTYTTGSNLDFTVNYSEAVTVNTGGGTPRLAITLDTGGTVYADYVSGSGTSALVFRYTVASGNLDSDGIMVGALSGNGGTLKDAAGNDAVLSLNGVGSTSAVLVDAVAPSVSSITRVSSATTNATSVDYTVTFAEGVTGVDAADFALTATGTAAGTIASVTQVNASTYTVTVNTISGDGTLRLDLNGAGTGIADTPGNAIAAGYTSGQTYTVDHTAPVVSSVGVPANATYVAGDNLDFTVNFAEAVTVDTSGGTPRIAITLDTGGTVYADYVSGSGTSALTFRYTVAAGVADANGIAVGVLGANGGSLKDAAGNNASLTLNSVGSTAAVLVDATVPTASIVVADTSLAVGQTSTVTITFSEAVSGFSNADLTVANGTLSAVSSSDGGVTWTATFTPTADVTDASNLITLDNTGVQDAVGNAGVGTTDSNNYAIDTLRPTATIVVADTALAAGETSTVTITFSEAVSGFSNADLTVANGTLSAVSSGDGGITWTATFTPTAAVTDASNLITLDNTGVQDAAGNAGTGTTNSNNYAIDTLRPTATVVVADTALAAGETSTVTITFSEAVSGLTTADFAVDHGSLSGLSSADGGVTWTATLTPGTNVTDASNLIVLDNTGVQDAAGNAGVGTTDSNNYAIDTKCPTATIVVADTALAAGETSTVTITFSEAVSGFSNADLTVANGTLSAVSSGDGGITWTATFTPTADVTDASNLITLDNTGVQDAAGNAGTGTTDSNNYAIDTLRPTATVVVADTALAAGETSTVTITFSEAVSGLTTADFAVEHGSLSGLSSADGGVTWTATLTPGTNVTDASNLITLDNTGVQDAAGNSGLGTTDSNNYAIDTLRPVITGVDVPAAGSYAAGTTLEFVVHTSEAVSLDAGGQPRLSITLDDGGVVFADYVSGAGGTALVFRYTVPAGVNDADGIVLGSMIDAHGALHDAAGNALATAVHGGAGAADIKIDTTAPVTVSISRSDTNPNSGLEGVSYTVTFSEDVSGVDLADFALSFSGSAHGSLAGISRLDGHTYVVSLQQVGGSGDLRLDLVAAGSGIVDAAGNAQVEDAPGQTYTIGGAGPVVMSQAWNALPAPSFDYSSDAEPLSPLRPQDLPTIFFGESAPPSIGLHPQQAFHRDPSVLPAARGLFPWHGLDPQTLLSGRRIVAGEAFSLRLPLALVANGGVVQLVTMDGRPLPSWMHFDPVAGTLEGVAPRDFNGQVLELTYRDGQGRLHTTTLELAAMGDRTTLTPPDSASVRHGSEQRQPLAGKPALQAQFGHQRQGGTLDHAALLRQLAVARQHPAATEAHS